MYPVAERDRNDNVIVSLSDTETIGFRFDTWVFTQLQKKINTTGFVSSLAKIGLETGDLDLISFQVLFTEAYHEFAFFEKKQGREVQTEALDERSCTELIDRMGGFLKAIDLLSLGLQTYVPKNLEAPQVGATSA